MRTVSFVALTLVMSVTSTVAQHSVGARLGYNRAWMYYGDVTLPAGAVTHVNRVSGHLLAYKQLSAHFEVGVEPGYVQRGAACVPGWIPVFIGDATIFIDYLELPVMLAYRLPLGNRFRLQWKLGYGASLAIQAAEQVLPPNSDAPFDRTPLDIGRNGDVKRLDHGAHGALSVAIRLGNGYVTIACNHYRSWHNASWRSISQNRGLALSVGYSMDLQRSKEGLPRSVSPVD